MTINQPIESFGDTDKQRLMEGRVRNSVRQGGLVEVLNVGFPEGRIFYYPKHQRNIVMPAPGATFMVPPEVATFLMEMPYGKKLQIVRGQKPANFTPPPGYKLVPADAESDESLVKSEDMLIDEPDLREEEVEE